MHVGLCTLPDMYPKETWICLPPHCPFSWSFHLPCLTFLHLNTSGSPLLKKLLIKVRAMKTGHWRGGWMSGWMRMSVFSPQSQSFAFTFSLHLVILFLHSLCGGSNFHEFDLMDRVETLICNNGLILPLKALPPALNLGLLAPLACRHKKHKQLFICSIEKIYIKMFIVMYTSLWKCIWLVSDFVKSNLVIWKQELHRFGLFLFVLSGI